MKFDCKTYMITVLYTGQFNLHKNPVLIHKLHQIRGVNISNVTCKMLTNFLRICTMCSYEIFVTHWMFNNNDGIVAVASWSNLYSRSYYSMCETSVRKKFLWTKLMSCAWQISLKKHRWKMYIKRFALSTCYIWFDKKKWLKIRECGEKSISIDKFRVISLKILIVFFIFSFIYAAAVMFEILLTHKMLSLCWCVQMNIQIVKSFSRLNFCVESITCAIATAAAVKGFF